jgi:arylformamidase
MNPKKIIDISWPITEDITTYKNKKFVSITPIRKFESDGVRESTIMLWSHTGTHVDAPAHFIDNGATVNAIDLRALVGSCSVLDMTNIAERITVSDLEKHEILAGDIVLFKTKNSNKLATAQDNQDFVYLDAEAAKYLVMCGVRAVGTDHLGIERGQPNHETHINLLGAGIIIIEGLRLLDVPAGRYFLCCLPLAIQGGDAAPARAVLLEF